MKREIKNNQLTLSMNFIKIQDTKKEDPNGNEQLQKEDNLYIIKPITWKFLSNQSEKFLENFKKIIQEQLNNDTAT